MKKNLLLSAVLFLTASAAWAQVQYVKFENNQFVDIPADQVQNVCKKAFVFREEHKVDAPKYLHGEILKAAFNGKLLPSLETANEAIKNTPGTCTWVTSEERGRLK